MDGRRRRDHAGGSWSAAPGVIEKVTPSLDAMTRHQRQVPNLKGHLNNWPLGWRFGGCRLGFMVSGRIPKPNAERRPGESAKAFHAFCHYRDLPVFSRSIDAAWAEHVRECLKHQTSTKQAPGNWKSWSAANDWPARAADHDDDLSRLRRERRAAELERAQDEIADLAPRWPRPRGGTPARHAER